MEKFLYKAMSYTLAIAKVAWSWMVIIEIIVTLIATFMKSVDSSFYVFIIVMEFIISIGSRILISKFEDYVKKLPGGDEEVFG